MTRIMQNYTMNNDEWEAISIYFPIKNNLMGRPRISNRKIFQAFLYLSGYGVSKRACKRFLGVSYDTLMTRVDEWIKAGVFQQISHASRELYDSIIGIDYTRIAIDGCITKSPNGGENTGRNPTDKAKSGTKRSQACDAKGVPLNCYHIIAGANVSDVRLFEQTLAGLPRNVPRGTILACDKGYRGPICKAAADLYGHQISIALTDDQILSERGKRWQVETLHRKYNTWRLIKFRTTRSTRRYKAILDIATALITWRMTQYAILTK